MAGSFLEEVTFKDANNALGEIDELMYDLDNRLTFNTCNIAESYCGGYAIIKLDIRSRVTGGEYRTFFQRLPSDFEKLKSTVSGNNNIGENALYVRSSDGEQGCVLIHDIKIMDGEQKLVPSVIWLESAYALPGGRVKLLYFSLLSMAFEYVLCPPEWKVDARHVGMSVLSGQATVKLIECGSDIMYQTADPGLDGCWNRLDELDLYVLLSSIRIVLHKRLCSARLGKGGHLSFEITDVSLGPFNILTLDRAKGLGS